jgi:glutamate dehydrogenase
MCVKNGVIPEFYNEYVKEVQSIIQNNARLEFEAIWREHEATKIPRSILSDTLSVAINNLSDELSHSELWHDIAFRNQILNEALPKTLVAKIGLDTVLDRVPDTYLQAIFGSYLAGRFIYERGANPSQFAFFDFMTKKREAMNSTNGGS